MPNEDDRFGDVAEQLKQTEGVEAETDEGDVETETRSASDASADEEADSAHERVESSGEERAGGPAFPFDETDMHGFYVREETWNRVTRMRSSVTAACSVFDVPSFEGREFQDACLRVLSDHGDEVALQILRERGIEADESRVREIVEILSDRADGE